MSLALQGCTPEDLSAALPEVTLGEARKVVSHVQRFLNLDNTIAQVRRVAMDAVRANTHVPSFAHVAAQRSALDPFVKHALRTHDGHIIEAVRIPLEKPGRYTVCLSSQAGCALACAFCATGRLGLLRNLETWEMVEQVRVVLRELMHEGALQGQRARIHGVVFQGMGEPLANFDRVLGAIRVMTEPSALAIDGRNITVCTSGLPGGMRRLAREAPKVRLALSVHSAIDTSRQAIMPIAKTHALEDVLDAAVEHARVTGLAPLWALTLLHEINDTPEQADAVASFAQAFASQAGFLPQLSIIPYNAIGQADPYRRTTPEREEAYRAVLRQRGLFSRKRYSGGHDVGAACGQLAGQALGTV